LADGSLTPSSLIFCLIFADAVCSDDYVTVAISHPPIDPVAVPIGTSAAPLPVMLPIAVSIPITIPTRTPVPVPVPGLSRNAAADARREQASQEHDR
jgi:hypothetical protein